MLVFSFFIIIEPRGALELKNGEFTLRGSNSYLMKEKEGYGVYINGEFIGDIKEIPKELSGLKILK